MPQSSSPSLPVPAVPERAVHRRARTLVAALVALALSVAGAAAVPSPAPAAPAAASSQAVAAAQQALGVAADGVVGPVTRRAVRRFQRANDLRVTGRLDRRTLRALGVDPAARRTAAAPQDGLLAKIARCESGGDPAAVSADGQYRGKYQFSRDTWQALGGTGDPAAAPEGLQDELAAKLLAERGTAPWPNCA